MNWKSCFAATCIVIATAASALAGSSELEAIKAADGAFYRALSSRDISAMMAVWADKPYVINIGPRSKAMNIGTDAVRKYWEGAFAFFSSLNVNKLDTRIQTDGKLAWAVGVEEAALQPKDSAEIKFQTFVTHVFEKDGSGWRLVSHHAQMIPK